MSNTWYGTLPLSYTWRTNWTWGMGFEVCVHTWTDVQGINFHQVAPSFLSWWYQLVNLSQNEQKLLFLSILDIYSQNSPVNSTHYSQQLLPMPAHHNLYFNQRATVSSKSVASQKRLIYGDDPSCLCTSQIHRVRGGLEIFIQTDKILPI